MLLLNVATLYHMFPLYIQGEIGFGEKGFKELVKGMTKGSGALQVIYSFNGLDTNLAWDFCMHTYVIQVLDIRYLGIKETHVSKLAESHLTSDGLRFARITHFTNTLQPIS
jgi:hypothetical protein